MKIKDANAPNQDAKKTIANVIKKVNCVETNVHALTAKTLQGIIITITEDFNFIYFVYQI